MVVVITTKVVDHLEMAVMDHLMVVKEAIIISHLQIIISHLQTIMGIEEVLLVKMKNKSNKLAIKTTNIDLKLQMTQNLCNVSIVMNQI